MSGKEKVIYDRKVDYRENTADYFIIKGVTNKSRVLELGCSTGYMTKHLHLNKECENSAIEIDEVALKEVEDILKYSIHNDLNKIEDWIDQLPNEYFDFIICQDVLEHIIEPFKVLKYLKNKLNRNGNFLISIPNISHNTIIMELLRDDFEYKDIGILDKTHIRFYTKKTFNESLKETGLICLKHFITYLVPDGTGWNTDYKNYSLEERNVLLSNGNGHVFQNLFVLGKDEEFKVTTKDVLYKLSLDRYDEVRIYQDGEETLYYYENEKYLEHIINKEGLKYIEIEPTIRPIEYTMEVYINEDRYNLWSFSTNDHNINKMNGNFINSSNQKLKINHKFKVGDIIRIQVVRKDDIIKGLVRGRLNMQNELNTLKKLVEENDVISFDIFDTLVLRNVLYPIDIFRLLEKYVKETYKISCFSKLRIECEEKTRKKFNHLEDINLNQIYDTLEEELKVNCDKIKAKELELERKFIVVNPFIKQIFDYCKELGKEIFIISDMYLEKEILEKILYKLGYLGYKELFVSCELNKTKATGSVYTYIKEKYNNINTNKWLHIGDNYISDVSNAKKNNINAYYYKSVRERNKIEHNLDLDIKESIMKAIQYNKIYCGLEIEYWEKLGVEYVAPIYYGFSDWLARINNKSDNLIFLSRDGYIPKLVFDKIKEKRNLDNIDSIYLYTSRKAYQLPSMAYMDKGELVECFTQSSEAFGHKLTIEEMFKNMSLDANEYIDIIKDFGFNSVQDEINGELKHNAKKIIQLIYDDIVKVLKSKCILVEEYMKSEGIFDYDKLNIVDIGWRGSIQHSMQKMIDEYYKKNDINKKSNINGYYLGTNQFVYSDIVDNTFGYYFDYSIPHYNSSFCIENLMMYEFIFTCPQPQLMGFEKENDKINPFFKEKVENKKYISALQAGALNIIDEFMEYDEYISGISIKNCTKDYREFITRKNYDDMIQFRKISNFISYESEERPYVTSYSKQDILKNREKIFEEIRMNLWPYAFIIDEIETQEEYKQFIIKNNLQVPVCQEVVNVKLLSKKNINKALKHPIKACKIILKKIILRILR